METHPRRARAPDRAPGALTAAAAGTSPRRDSQPRPRILPLVAPDARPAARCPNRRSRRAGRLRDPGGRRESSISPSTTATAATAPAGTSTSLAVMRIRAPRRWYPPPTTHRTPAVRPTSTRLALDSAGAPGALSARNASRTRSRPTDCNDDRRSISAVTVSAIPAPIQSSAGPPLMLTNGRIAIPAGASPWAATAAGASPPMRTANTTRIREGYGMDWKTPAGEPPFSADSSTPPL